MLLLLFLLLLSTYVLNTHILKVGIIGVGRIGRCHCASVASVPTKAKVVMICDIYQPALDEVSAIFHVPKTTNDPMEVCMCVCSSPLRFHPTHVIGNMPPSALWAVGEMRR